MTLAPPQRLGPYEIVAPLGAGGMGEVYRARDTRLGREVAIKVMPAGVAQDPERVRRFELEARAASALNHPNILTVFDVGAHEGAPYLVLELLDGESLRDVLSGGALPPRKAVEIAAQVARGLAAAHEAGIVHRDLKPENLFVRRGGQVKILDFGLAKLVQTEGGILNDAPTVAEVTGSGVVLGTVGYMSPEQVRGDRADGRSDVFALGCVLHEMLSGERAFRAPTAIETLNAILKSDPPELSGSGRRIPPSLGRIVRHCLEKRPEERFQSARDLAFDLESLSRDDGEAVASSSRPSRRRTRWLAVPVAMIALASLGFLAGWALRQTPAPTPAPITDASLRKLTFEPGLEAEPSFSPDGHTLAYATNESGSLDIALLPLAGGQVRKLVATAADEAQPAWSPDGTRIAYTAGQGEPGRLASVPGLNRLTPFVQGRGGEIRLVPAAGGPSVRLIDHGSFPAWSPDGREIVFQSDRDGNWNIWRAAAQGGEPKHVTADNERNFQPAWSPDGKWIAFSSARGLRVAPADGGTSPRLLIAAPSAILSPRWSADGRWIYFSWFRGQATPSLWRAEFRAEAAADDTPPVERMTLGESGDVDVALSRDGRRFAWSQSVYAPDLWELDRRSGALRQLSTTSCAEDYPHHAADGRTLLFQSDCGGGLGLWTLDLPSGQRTPLTPPEIRGSFARWSPDGTALLYLEGAPDLNRLMVRARAALDARERARGNASEPVLNGPQWQPTGERIVFARAAVGGGGLGTMITTVDGAGREQVVFRPPKGDQSPLFSPLFPTFLADGRSIVFQMEDEGGPRQLWIVPASGGAARILTQSALEHSHPQTTPARPDEILIVVDHKNVAVVSARTGVLTYLTHFDDSTLVVDYPSWSHDGSKIYFSITRKLGDLYLLDNLGR